MAIKYNANYIETMPFSDVCEQVNLASSVNLAVTVPGDATQQFQAYFEYASNSNVFVCLNSVAVIPASGTAGSEPYCEYKPKKRYVKGGDVLNLITPDSVAYLGISFRQIQG